VATQQYGACASPVCLPGRYSFIVLGCY
jgi:hypothetical protein